MRARIKGLWKVLFGRTTIFVFLILIQLIVIVAGIGFLGTKVLVANNIVGVLSISRLLVCLFLFTTGCSRERGTSLAE